MGGISVEAGYGRPGLDTHKAFLPDAKRPHQFDSRAINRSSGPHTTSRFPSANGRPGPPRIKTSATPHASAAQRGEPARESVCAQSFTENVACAAARLGGRPAQNRIRSLGRQRGSFQPVPVASRKILDSAVISARSSARCSAVLVAPPQHCLSAQHGARLHLAEWSQIR
jgi:hypothetical protein